MSVPTLNGIPLQITAGTTAIFTVETTPQYPVADWTMTFYAGLNGAAPAITKVATTSGTQFLVSLSVDDTKVSPGVYNYWCRLESGGQATILPCGKGTFQLEPNPTLAQPLTWAAAELARIEVALTTIGSTPFISTSFNGQSQTISSREDLMDYRTRLMAEVIAQQNALTQRDPGRVITQFVDPSLTVPPFGRPFGYPYPWWA